MSQQAFASAIASLGLSLTEDQLQQFAAFEDALYAFNEVKNLTRVPREEAWSRHFIDSLIFQDLFPQGSEVLDIGTGPGFPAWPLACARPDLHVTALDSNGKMLAFLKGQPLPNLRTVQVRAEEWGMRERFDVVTGRALAPLALQLEVSAPLCRIGGFVLPLRTPQDREQAEQFHAAQLGLSLREAIERQLPGTDAGRMCPVFEKLGETPRKYPRRWAEMKTKPLT